MTRSTGGYYGYGGYAGIAVTSPYYGVYAPFGGASPIGHSTIDDVFNFMGSF
jgi:hypothetical protein